MQCDECTEPATVRIQGETDSFGCEMIDLCAACRKKELELEKTSEALPDKCDWCKSETTEARPTRDHEEGPRGPVYWVCPACRTKQIDDAEREYSDYFDDWGDYDD